jgi:uncharacterized protein (TIGR03435 family)
MSLGTMCGGPGTDDPERISYRAVTALAVLRLAFGKTDFEIEGSPSWFTPQDAPRFDIVAKVPPGATKQQLAVMLQNLLADRFGLKVHHESKQLLVNTLVIAKSGFKLKEAEEAKGGSLQFGSLQFGASMMKTRGAIPVSLLASAMQNRLKELVVDKTGLTGNYAFNAEFDSGAPATGDAAPLPSLATALEQDFGLKLQRTKTDVDILVIDHIEKTPTEN